MTAAAGKSADRPRVGAQAAFVLVFAGALLWAVINVPQRDWRPPPDVPLTLAGEHYRVSPSEMRWLETYSSQHFAAGRDAARAAVATEIERQLDAMFAKAEARLPEFADWYYSLRGEYTRMAMTALATAKLTDPGYVTSRATEMLFPDNAWTEDLDRLGRAAEARLVERESQDRASWLAEVTRRLSASRVPAPLSSAPAAADSPVELDRLVEQIGAREHGALETRMSLSAIAAGGAAIGPAVWRSVGARASAAAGRAAAERVAARGAARVGTAALGSAAVCSPGGPFALGCALVAGTAAWIGTDWALLSIDERLHREELLQDLDAGLTDVRRDIEHELLDAYDALVAGRYDAVEDGIHKSFVPARAGGAAAQ